MDILKSKKGEFLMEQEQLFYDMIFKRKSFHIFKDTQGISTSELEIIEKNIRRFNH